MKDQVAAFSPGKVTEMADMFRLLGEPNRLRLVLACMVGARGVGELSDELALPQTLASHHLRLLRTARILKAEREGRHVRYSLDDAHVRDVVANMVAHLTEPHDHRMAEAAPPDTRTRDEDDGDRHG